MIKTKYISKVGKDYKISEHFTLGEFMCHNGTDIVKFDTQILKMLEKLRAKYGGKIAIISGYRPTGYNASIGGAVNSAHIDGQAVDFVVYDKDGKVVNPKKVCLYLESIKWKWGIGQMRTAVHMDTKFTGNRMDETKTPYIYLQRKGLTFRKYYGVKDPYKGKFPTATVNKNTGTKTNIKRWQLFLNWYGQDVVVSGKFDNDTIEKTKKFQRNNKLEPDGSAGMKETIPTAMKVKR